MQDSYECISRVWSDYPEEFNNLSLCEEKIKLQNLFEEKKVYFRNYITKILIIGEVSAGKSTLINSLLGKKYFETTTGNGTVAFFYCCQTEKDYEYFQINDDIEVKDMDLLMNTQGLNVSLPDFIDQYSILNVYIKNDVNKLLQKRTVIVDCPGFGHNDDCNEKINYHCSTADIIIFIFDYNTPATLKQRNCIKEIRKKFRSPACLFVYNKCDEIEFDNQKLKNLKDDFVETFNELYHEGPNLGVDALYFISAQNPNMGNDYKRLTSDILAHKNVNYIRYINVRSLLTKAINTYKESIITVILIKKREKMELVENLNEINRKSNVLNKQYLNLTDFLGNLIDEGSKDIQIEKILNVIFSSMRNYKETCTKHEAFPFILNLSNFIDKEICEYLKNLLNDKVISKINYKIEDIKTENLNEINIIENIEFIIEKHFSFLVTDLNLNIFWPHEKGDKTKKVKKAYNKFLQKEEVKNKIFENISKFYSFELLKINGDVTKFVENSERKNLSKIHQFQEELEYLKNLLKSLEKYENNVLEFSQSYHAALY